MRTQHTTAYPPADHTWQLLTDDELARWLTAYRRRRLLADEEIAADVRAESVAFLDHLIAGAEREERRRRRAPLPTPAARYGADFVADLKRRVALDALCEHELGAELGRLAGGRRQGPCPICRGGHNCFTVYLADPDDQHFYCFRCQARGDAIGAIQLAYGDPFPQAVERLCRFGGITPPDPDAERKALIASLPGRVAD